MKFSNLDQTYDIVIAGGGITGAGIFHEAVKRGYSVLLAESRDFAWGTSSRSSKMVHGGLRYLSQGKFLLTRAAVKEREFLLRQYPGLINPLHFIMPLFDHYGPSKTALKLGLSLYSLMAGEKQHKAYTKQQALNIIPGIRKENFLAALGFRDAQVDDARLVLRLIYDACQNGGTAFNYTSVTGFDRDRKDRLSAVFLKDKGSGREIEVKTSILINATGAFAETLHPAHKQGLHIRPLRGSHLVFPSTCFDPCSFDPTRFDSSRFHPSSFQPDRVLSFFHPVDLRPIFIFPWEGVLVLGTTDVDHKSDLSMEPGMTKQEADYLMEGLNYVLPDCPLNLSDCISSIAGIRPVLSRKKAAAASKESREHVVWQDKGLVTVTGGKLTTFRLLARDALKAAEHYLPSKASGHDSAIELFRNKIYDRSSVGADPCVCPANGQGLAPTRGQLNSINKDSFSGLSPELVQRICGRYGHRAASIILEQDDTLLAPIENTRTIWAEIRYAAEHENVHHLSDLMLRRVRLGLLLPHGGIDLLGKVESLCRPFLPWDDERWKKEKKEYALLWNSSYSPP